MPEKIYLPMLAKQGSKEDLKRKDMIFEIKFDGTRAICYIGKNSVKFLNRRKTWIEHRYPELKDIWKSISAKRCVLDGEIVVFDGSGKPDFNALQQREHVESEVEIKLLSKIAPAAYIVFDVLEVDGEEMLSLPLEKRKEILEKLVKDCERLRKSVWVEDGEKLWKFVEKHELEGVMAKKKGSAYIPGRRSEEWLKIKRFSTMDCVVIGYTEGKGRRRDKLGALLLAAYRNEKLWYLGRVGTGFDEQMLDWLKSELKILESRKVEERIENFDEPPEIKRITHFVLPKIVVEVKFLEFTKNKKLRAPVFLRIRNDKPAEECEL